MAAKKHTFFKYGFNGFFNGTPKNTQLYPFNCEEMADPIDYSDADCSHSLYFTATGKKGMNFIPGIARAIQRLLVIDNGSSFGLSGKDWGGVYYNTKTGETAAEYWDGSSKYFNAAAGGNCPADYWSNSRKILIKISPGWRMSACCAEKDGQGRIQYSPYRIQTVSLEPGTHSASAAVFGILAKIVTDSLNSPINADEQIVFNNFVSLLAAYTPGADPKVLVERSRILENDLYTMIALPDQLKNAMGAASIDPAVFDAADIPFWDYQAEPLNSDWKTDSATTAEYLGQDAALLAAGSQSTAEEAEAEPSKKIEEENKPATVADIASSKIYFIDPGRTLSDPERALVPDKGAMIPDREVLEKAKLLTASTKSPHPFRNILWTGETGTGKTTSAQMLAQVLNLPYVFLGINPDTLVSDLYVNILPADGSKEQASVQPGLEKPQAADDLVPILSEAIFDPEGAYKKLTGQQRDNVKTSEVVSEVLNRAAAMGAGSAGSNKNDFIYVESPLVKAYRYGWLCELQEVNLAMKPGVLAGINSALDDVASIVLPSGEVVRRHPDTVIVATANIGYEGTKNMNQAFKRRMSLKGFFHLPEDKQLIERVKANSGYKSKTNIRKMLKVMREIRKVLAEDGETGGSCSICEVEAWAQAAAILGSPYAAAMATIVPSASDDEEVLVDVKTALETQFLPE